MKIHYEKGAAERLYGLAFAAAVVVIIAAAVEIYRELHHFCVTKYEVTSRNINSGEKGIRILFLSDLHNRVYGKNNDLLLKAIKEQSPDLILIGGDMVVGKQNLSNTAALNLVLQLPDFCPVIYAFGNHEQRKMELEEDRKKFLKDYCSVLERKGVIFLVNKTVELNIRGNLFKITGLNLPMDVYAKFHKSKITSNDIKKLTKIDINEQKREEQGKYSILLAHNPTYMDAYLDCGSDMILSGHLHGGLIRIPKLGGLITPQGFLFPKYSGEMTEVGNQTVIVSRGLGSHTLNIRLFNIPEAVLITLRSKKPL